MRQTRAAVLRSAQAHVEQVMRGLNTRGTKCECCGTMRYEDFNERNAYLVLEGMAEKLERLAGSEVMSK